MRLSQKSIWFGKQVALVFMKMNMFFFLFFLAQAGSFAVLLLQKREREREREGKKERKRGEGETTLSEYGIIGFLFSFLEEKKRAVGTGLEHGSIKLATNRLCGEVFSRRGCRATSVSSAE